MYGFPTWAQLPFCIQAAVPIIFSGECSSFRFNHDPQTKQTIIISSYFSRKHI